MRDTNTKLCKDCKWYRPQASRFLFWKIEQPSLCGHPQLVNLVTGKPWVWCKDERGWEFAGKCKKAGLLWEPVK